MGESGGMSMYQRIGDRFKNLQIRTWLIISFLSVSLIPLFLVTSISYKSSKKAIMEEVLKNLNSIATRQSSEIENYVRDKELVVTALTKDPTIIEALADFTLLFGKEELESPQYQKIQKELFPFFSNYQESSGFQNLYLISAKGDIVYSLKKAKDLGSNLVTGPYRETGLAKVFNRSTTLLETDVSDFHTYPATGEPAAFISSPVIKEGRVLGALVFQISNDKMYKVVNDYTGLGQTGETLIVSKIGDSGVYMTPTRFDPDAAFKKTFRLNDSEEPFLQKILRGNRVAGITKDYRGEEVFAVGYFFLPALQWGLLVKADTAELFAPIKFLEYLLIGTTALIAILVVVASFLIAKSIIDPINMLILQANKIAKGDLSHRIKVTSKNEVGLLSESFNLMSDQLDHLIRNLDGLVKARTREVEDKNSKLTESLQKLKSMQEQLVIQEKLASLGQLTAGIAHEIKNPLNFVNNFAQLCEKQIVKMHEFFAPLKERLTDTEKTVLEKIVSTIDANIKKIHQYGVRADSIVRNMLSHSRDGSSSNFQLMDLNTLLEENFKLVYHAKRAQDSTFNIQMQMKFDEDLGLVEILPQEIGRVTLNLLNNAFYAVHQKKKALGENFFPIVTITTKKEGKDKISISFYDNGTGIPPNIIEKLFTPFYTTKPPGEGTGLGLSLSREIIVAAHHGEMHLESKEGEFTNFTITLPKKQVPKESGDEKNIGG